MPSSWNKFGQRLQDYSELTRKKCAGKSGNWAAYATAAGAAMAMASNASAAIIYCSAGNNYCGNAASGVIATAGALNPHIHIATAAGNAGAATHNIHLELNVQSVGSSIAFSAGVLGAKIKFFDTSGAGTNLAKNFQLGSVIGPTVAHAHLGVNGDAVLRNLVSNHFGSTRIYGNFSAGTPGVVGFAAYVTGGKEYGWIRLQYEAALGEPTSVRAIDWAINTTVGQAITAPTPEPGTLPLALLASGAAGIAALRRRRAKSNPVAAE